MTEDRDWDRLSKKLLRNREVQAPPYLWTRVLAAIEAREAQLEGWWRQLGWMSKIATGMAVFVAIVAGTLAYEELDEMQIEHLLEGTSVASETLATPNTEEITTAWLVEGKSSSWEQN